MDSRPEDKFVSMLAGYGGELIAIPKNLLMFCQNHFGINELELIENTIHSVQKIIARPDKFLNDKEVAFAALPKGLSEELKGNLIEALVRKNGTNNSYKELIPVVRDVRCERIATERYRIELEIENHQTGMTENVSFLVNQQQMKNIYEMDKIRQQLFHSVTSSSS